MGELREHFARTTYELHCDMVGHMQCYSLEVQLTAEGASAQGVLKLYFGLGCCTGPKDIADLVSTRLMEGPMQATLHENGLLLAMLCAYVGHVG